MTYALAGALVLVAAWTWHGVTEHHWHLKYFWRYARPGTVVPATRHDTRWHSRNHGQRLGYDAGMAAVAGLLGAGWQLEPEITTFAVAVAAALVTAWVAARGLGRAFGERHRNPAIHRED